MRNLLVLAWAGVAMATPARSAVTATGDHGFAIESSATISAGADVVYALLILPARWWNSAHSYSGDAANMRIEPHAGGCFCEALPSAAGAGGSVEHARVIFAMPARQLRLSGALGPLQEEGVTGTLTFIIAPSGKNTQVTMSYVVGGYMRSDPVEMAPLVDQVLNEQLQGLKRAAEAPPS